MAASITLVDIDQDEILTGEAVALDVQPVGFFLRALGLLIDWVASILLAVLVFITVNWLGTGVFAPETATILTITMIVLVTVVLPTTIETATRGRSLGKLAIGGRIVRNDGGAIGFRHAFIRALTGVLEIWMTLGAVAAVTGIFTARSQRLGDLLAGTYSERTRSPKLTAFNPQVPPALTEWARTADVAPLSDRLARRVTQFLVSAEQMAPHARTRVASELAAAAAASVSPLPTADPETFIRAVAALRFQREYSAIALRDERAASLLSTGSARA